MKNINNNIGFYNSPTSVILLPCYFYCTQSINTKVPTYILYIIIYAVSINILLLLLLLLLFRDVFVLAILLFSSEK